MELEVFIAFVIVAFGAAAVVQHLNEGIESGSVVAVRAAGR